MTLNAIIFILVDYSFERSLNTRLFWRLLIWTTVTNFFKNVRIHEKSDCLVLSNFTVILP